MSGPAPPARIKKLDATVVNRIAAGEVIHRPAHALKELLENALDAGATSVAVTVKDGGLTLLQIQDNGSGIHADDLPVLCERFTTSKLRAYDDLTRIATYGFRGEALASISHVAHLTVVTRTADSPVAYRAQYADGNLVPAPGQTKPAPKPCAGNQGTLIQVEQLFYNVRNRLKAMKPANDEYHLVLDVVARYAVHNAQVAVSLRKAGAGSVADVATTGGGTPADKIKIVYGAAVAKELLSIDDTVAHDCQMTALVTNPNYSTKKFTFLLFINNRLVESPKLKRALDALYAPFMPKGMHPFVYLALTLPPHKVDVNVHPTKQHVQFLHEEEIIAAIRDRVLKELQSANASRHFAVQTLLPGSTQGGALGLARAPSGPATASGTTSEPSGGTRSGTAAANVAEQNEIAEDDMLVDGDEDFVQPPPPSAPPRSRPPTRPPSTAPSQLVRTDARATTLDQFFTVTPRASASATVNATQDDAAASVAPTVGTTPARGPTPVVDDTADPFLPLHGETRDLGLTSITELAAAVAANADPDVTAVFAEHKYVGPARGTLVLVQAGTALYLVDAHTAMHEWGYQRALELFANFPAARFDAPVDVRVAVRVALDMEEAGWTEGLPPKDTIAETVTALLVSRADMLLDYFSMEFTADGHLLSVPRLLARYAPPASNIPLFLLRLGTEVDWDEELPCMQGVLAEIGLLYSPIAIDTPDGTSSHTLQHVLFPALRSLRASREGAGATVVRVANLHELYKVFERC
ncbi:DNA mismatch repair protein MutL [Allomyces macrogynus ATCC 38327]|uniref:DNA mismatch repair protein MutL n=1 Tax=Allomyces macrogynus (strain ATCC 38327) TaxID=578462 RepID=A0A0L0SK78_ALLM3|nr:DNA mismatch repair protein MutL [Allomyces macrogynus ATCC 38327]|eukprot:KNE62896.1 DNA mismatch repair protein MutL [Allomyces macrogynus ATCC 38327]